MRIAPPSSVTNRTPLAPHATDEARLNKESVFENDQTGRRGGGQSGKPQSQTQKENYERQERAGKRRKKAEPEVVIVGKFLSDLDKTKTGPEAGEITDSRD